MRKFKKFLKLVAFSLSVLLVTQVLPLSTLATELNNQNFLEQAALENPEDNIPDIVEEVDELRGEYTKHFRREDGSYIAAVYSEPVHYQKDGEWKNISNELKENNNTLQMNNPSGTKYTITETSTPLSFPENINTGKITINKNGNTISFGAIGNSNITSSTVTISEPKKLISASVANKQSERLTGDETQFNLAADTEASAITYLNAFNGASLEYEVSSSIVKESIVVSKRSDSYRYEFSIDFGSFVPVYDDLTGGIYVYETAQSSEPVMAITPPYMFDADGITSDAVTMQLIPNATDYTLVIEADSDWINSIFRKFPVVIDPTFDLDIAKKNVDDIHVNQNKPNRSYKLDYQLEVGRNNNNLFRTYIKYILPELPDCSVITNANLTLVQNWSRSFDATDVYLNVYQCESSWDFDSLTWNTQPIQDLSAATIVDYTNFVGGMSAEYNLNITKIVKDWYENGENYGLMLALSDETVEEKTSFYATRNIVSNYPSLTVSYVNNTGVEDYWDYETISLGRSGTAYVNLYNGELTYIHGDASTSGLRAPVTLSHIYNQSERNASGTFNEMNFGKRFRMNIVEQIEATGDENYPYKYIDADGTVHFFAKTNTANQYIYEFDSNIILNKLSTGFTMNFTDGSCKEFDTLGYWAGESDSNSNEKTVYTTGKKTLGVYDGGTAYIGLEYNSDNTLKTITDTAGREISYTYNSSGMLTAITYADGTSTQYAYNANSLLEQITTNTNARIKFEYKQTYSHFRVSKITLYGENSNNSESITLDYRTRDTLTENSNGDKTVYAFDTSGRAINKTVNGKSVSVAEYNNDGNLKNTLKKASNTFEVTESISPYWFPAKTSSVWDISYDTYDGQTSYMRSEGANISTSYLALSRTAKGSLYTHYKYNYAQALTTYTVSAYVNVYGSLSQGDAYLKIIAGNASGDLLEVKSVPISTTDNQWRLLTATITTPADTTYIRIECGIYDAVGILFVDAVWFEESDVSNRLNLVQNPKFRRYDSKWVGNGAYGVSDVTEADGNVVMQMVGDPNNGRFVEQHYYLNGKAGDTIVFGGSAKALCSSSGNNGTRFFGIRVILYDQTQNILQTKNLYFDSNVYDTMQTKIESFVAEQDYRHLRIELRYDFEINTAVFDDIFLFRDYYGTEYTYNSEGKLTRAESDNGYAANYSYTNHDLTGVTQTYNETVIETASYSYDSSHNLLSATGSDGVTTSYAYNGNGLPESVTVTDGAGLSSTTAYTYGVNNHYISTVTDPSGGVTRYAYNWDKGLITSVTDPNGNITSYTYDPNNDNLLSISNPSAELENPATSFTYASGRTASISNSDVEYSLSYDSFGRSTQTKLENNSLITYSYNDKELLEGAVYGNGDTVAYTYTEDYCVSSEIYNGTAAYKYGYNSEGQLSKITDFENDVIWNYRYDLMGRPTVIENTNGIYAGYDYDAKGNPASLTVRDGSSLLLRTAYTYDAENRPSAVTIGSMANSPVQTYAYDSFGRTQSISSAYNGTNKVVNNYTYLTNGTNQTGMVGSVDYVKTTADGSTNILPTLSYTYDANGNITHIYENGVQKVKYYYDGLNRLVREDNPNIDKTVVYCYDKSGDILSKSEYALTDSETLGTATATFGYQYSDSRHPNGLTAYDGDTVTYDANGNPLTYRSYTMNWEKGRQLESMTDGTDTLSFKYDSSGIRTSKTVNGVETEFVYIGTTLVSQKTNNEILNFAYSANGSPYGFTYNGTSYFYLLNLQGDVIGIYDSNGNIVVNYVYDSWGKLVSITGSLAETVGVKNPLRYRGYYYDTETSLYYLQSRYYDPDTCRFINADSLLVAGDYVQGTNMFAYCINNPVMYVDPSGHEPGIEEALYSILGTIFGLMYLVEILPIEQIEVFMKSVADAGSTSGTIVADAVLGLCEIVSGNYNGKLDEGGIFDYTYSWYREENIYHLSIEGEEAYIFKNDYNSSSIDDFVQNTNTLSGVVIATITTALVGAGSLAIGAICSGVGIVSVGLGSLTVTTSAFLKTGITVLGSTLISSIYNVFSKENLDYLFSVIVDGKTS